MDDTPANDNLCEVTSKAECCGDQVWTVYVVAIGMQAVLRDTFELDPGLLGAAALVRLLLWSVISRR